MKLIQTYAHYCGVKPEEAFIDEQYYPVPLDNYIVVHNGTGMKTKTYDNFEDVVCNLRIPVVQVGGKDDVLLPNVLDLRGKTTWGQTASIIHSAKLFLGGDSVCAHIAAHFKVKSVVLWGGTLPSTCCTDWNAQGTINLSPIDRRGCASACHFSDCLRGNKCINSISVETVLKSIQSLIGDVVDIPNVLHIGALAKQSALEWVPMNCNEQTFNMLAATKGIVSVRGDLTIVNVAELSNICSQLKNNKFVIILKGGEEINKISIPHGMVEQLLIYTDKTNINESIASLKTLTSRMYKCRLISRLSHDEFNDYKTEFLDYPPMARLIEFENQDKFVHLVGKNLSIKTHRKVIGKDGKCHLSIHDALKEKNVVDFSKNNANINLENGHLKELQFFTISEKIK